MTPSVVKMPLTVALFYEMLHRCQIQYISGAQPSDMWLCTIDVWLSSSINPSTVLEASSPSLVFTKLFALDGDANIVLVIKE